MCNMEALETNAHLFYECPFAAECWDGVGIDWDNHPDIQHKYERAKARWQGPLFKEITILTSWNIWKQRNR